MLKDKLYLDIMNEKIIENNDKIVIGVSGGPDSMFLLHVLATLIGQLQLELYVAHINHHTRGEENNREQNLIKSYCEMLGIPFFVYDFFQSSNDNFHEEARQFRYECFKNLARTVGANKIALAHHKNDQVETILFKLIRGNNLIGYTGIKSAYQLDRGVTIVRPLLKMTKQEILNYCHEYNVSYAIDSSNLKSNYTRNYIRNDIVPLLTNIQSDFDDKMIQFQEQLSEVNDFLIENAKIMLHKMIISHEKDRIILDLTILSQTHISLIRMILLDIIKQLTNNQLDLSYEKIKNLLSIIFNKKPNITFNLGKNYYCIREYNHLVFQLGNKNSEGYYLELNGINDYILPNGMKISMKISQEKAKINNNCIILCYNSTIWPLVIRTKRNGDVIKTKFGSKKINRIFIDAKIPVSLRETWPLLLDNNGEILWVIGIQKGYIDQSDCDQFLLIEVM